MTATGARANGSRAPNGHRTAVKNEASPFPRRGTPNGYKGDAASRSRSPDGADDNGKSSPSDSNSIVPPDTSTAAVRLSSRKAASIQKPSRSATPTSRPARVLYDHLPDATAEATSHFQVIPDCLYGSKNMGVSELEALDCDCSEEWRMASSPVLSFFFLPLLRVPQETA